MNALNLGPASQRLLQLIAEYDRGEGVQFASAPRARWRHEATGQVFNNRTFWPLAREDLINVGDGRGDPVKITAKGRDALEGRS